MVPSTESSGNCECKSVVASSSRFSLLSPPEPVGSDAVMCSMRVSRCGKESYFALAAESKNYFVGIFQPKCDGVAVLQFAALDFFAVDKQPTTLALIFDVILLASVTIAAQLREMRRSRLQMVAGFRAAPDEKGSLGYANVTPRAVRRDDLEYGFG